MSPGRKSCAGFGRRAMAPRCCGTTGAGICCPPAGSSSPVLPARSLRCPSPSTLARGVHLFAGEFDVAASLVAQVESVTEATGSSIAPYAALGLAACRGQEVKALELIEAATKDAQRRVRAGD